MNLPFNWFDLLLVAALACGMAQGRKRGMSCEWLALLQWFAILFGCAALYQPAGELISRPGVFSIVSSCLIAYLGGALLILLFFSWVTRRLRSKTEGTDFFGRNEYYLAMGSGALRASCMLLVGLALLNAPSFSPAEVRAMEAYQSSNFGSQFFPSLPTVQASVFDRSLSGPWIKHTLGFLLIHPSSDQAEPTKRVS